jgi:NAD+-dependent protein deacetylase sirtuin 2
VFAHGSFAGAHCIDCKAAADIHHVKSTILAGDIPRCESCKTGLVKPDIVFFGESLPRRFFDLSNQDFGKCDLLIIMGTSLTVQPFAGLINRVGRSVPRVLINREKVAQADPRLAALGVGSGLDFNAGIRDVPVLGDLQGNIEKFAELLGWSEDLSKLVTEGTKDFEKELLKAQAEVKAAHTPESSSAPAPAVEPTPAIAPNVTISTPSDTITTAADSSPAPAASSTTTPTETSKPNL